MVWDKPESNNQVVRDNNTVLSLESGVRQALPKRHVTVWITAKTSPDVWPLIQTRCSFIYFWPNNTAEVSQWVAAVDGSPHILACHPSDKPSVSIQPYINKRLFVDICTRWSGLVYKKKKYKQKKNKDAFDGDRSCSKSLIQQGDRASLKSHWQTKNKLSRLWWIIIATRPNKQSCGAFCVARLRERAAIIRFDSTQSRQGRLPMR